MSSRLGIGAGGWGSRMQRRLGSTLVGPRRMREKVARKIFLGKVLDQFVPKG